MIYGIGTISWLRPYCLDNDGNVGVIITPNQNCADANEIATYQKRHSRL